MPIYLEKYKNVCKYDIMILIQTAEWFPFHS